MAVKTAPTRIPRIGFRKRTIRSRKNGEVCSGCRDSPIVDMPMKRKPNPASTSPNALTLSFPEKNMIRQTPAKAKIGAIASRFKAISCPVTVVPTLVPMMTLTVWATFMIPAFTNPTSMLVTAEDD